MGHIFFIHTANLCLGVFRPFAFEVFIGTLELTSAILFFIFIIIIFCLFAFSRATPRHMEVPRVGV